MSDAPQGTDLQIGYGIEQAENIWVPPVTKFFKARSVTGFLPKRSRERTGNMSASGQTLKGVPGSALLSPKIDFDPDVNSVSPLLAHLCGKPPTITVLSGAAQQWAMTPREFSEAAPATWIDSLFFEISDGDGYPVLITGNRISEWALKGSGGKIVTNSFSMLGCFDSYQSDPTVLTAPLTYTGKPVLRGHRATANKTATLKGKITALAGGGNSGTMKFTTAAYAGSTTVPFIFDVPFRVSLDTGARFGVSRIEDLWCIVPSTSPATAVDVGAEWSFVEPRTLATPTYSTLDPLSSIGMTVMIDGAEKYFRDVDFKITKPRKHNVVVGRKYAVGVQKGGEIAATVTFSRDRDDRAFLEKMITSSTVAVVIDIYGNPIGSTGFDERLTINLPNGDIDSDDRDVNTADTLPEKIDVTFHRSGSTDIFDITVANTLSAL